MPRFGESCARDYGCTAGQPKAYERVQSPDDYRSRCRRAGHLRLRRITSSRRDVTDGIEATQNFLDGQDWESATEIATGVADFLAQDSNLRRLSFAT